MNDLTFYQLTQQRKIRTAGWLMVLSIVLLVLFQGYWLRKTYRDEYQSLRRELSLILRETTLRRQMQQLTADSNWRGSQKGDSSKMLVGQSINISQDTSKPKEPLRMEVRMGYPLDSSAMRSRPRVFSIDAERRNEPIEFMQEIVIYTPVIGDTKNIRQIDSLYRKALLDNEIELEYTLRGLNRKAADSLLSHDAQRFSFNGRRNIQMVGIELLQVKFEHPFWTIIGKMTLPIFFSLAMLGITITAFLFLYKSLKSQQRLALLKNDFISNMTHELKTPIATVGVAIEALKNFHALNDPKRTQEYLDISAGELQRLNLLVDKVLRVSMFEQDKMELQQTAVDLTSLAQQVVSSMRLQLEKAHAQCELHAAPAVRVKADALHLQSVLYNLLDNALKYSGDKPSIDIHITQTDGRVQLRVSDKGQGIPAEYSDKVFDKFFRVPHGDTHNIKGYGLGLSYVAEVIKKHGGSIRVEPVQPHGACFVIELQSA